MSAGVVIVTGGFGVLGCAVGAQLAASGHVVALVDQAPRAPAAVVDAAGRDAVLLAGVDLAQPTQAEQAIAEVLRRCGRVDGLANVAGGFEWQTLADGDIGTWDAMQRINLATALNASRAVLPHLRRQGRGRIVNVGAAGALQAGLGMGAYAASKAGVHRLTEALAAEVKLEGITVNAVLPSIIDTPRNRAQMADQDFSRWVAPADLAAVIGFLFSDASRAVTGALIPVTGRT